MNVDQWIQCNQGLIVSAAKPYTKKGLEYEDLIQEANLAAVIAIKKFDESRKWSVESWVYYNIQRYLEKKVGAEIKHRKHEFTDEDLVNCNLMFVETNKDEWSCPTEEQAIQRVFLGEIVEFKDTVMSETEKSAFNDLITQESSQVIAERKKIHRTTVIRRKNKVRNLLTESFSGWLDVAVVL